MTHKDALRDVALIIHEVVIPSPILGRVMELESPFVFRPYSATDVPFISSSWASSYYAASRIKDILSPEQFHNFHRPLRERFFARPTRAVIVVCPEEEPEVILGWVATEVLPNCTVLHYVYVKSIYRHEYHLARELILRAVIPGPVLFTHATGRAMRLIAANPEKFRQWRYSPHLS